MTEEAASYEETEETLALLRLLALGNKQVARGKVRPLAEAVEALRGRKPNDPPRS